MKKKLIEKILKWGKARWIIDEDGDPGIRIFGINIIYYKWDDLFIVSKLSRFRSSGEREITTLSKVNN